MPSRKRSRLAGEDAHDEHDERRSPISTGSNSMLQGSVRRPAVPAAFVARDVRAVVLENADLLQHIMVMLAGPSKQARADVGKVGSVCRLWRVISRRNYVWRGIATGLFPVLSLRGLGDESGVVCWEHVRRFGRGLIVRDVWGQRDWEERLSVRFEVWDEMDDLRMLSASGRLRLSQDGGGNVVKTICRDLRAEVVGSAFSAASRDPAMGRLGSVREYFERAHLPEYPSRLRVRVAVTDETRGRTAVLWDAAKGPAPYTLTDPIEWWQQRLPPESLFVASLSTPLTTKAGLCISANWGVYISPATGQAADVHDGARLWTVAPTPVVGLSSAQIVFKASKAEVQAFILSALA